MYYASRNRYIKAANQLDSTKKALKSCRAEKTKALSDISSCRSNKLNFEQRIENIKSIIAFIEGTSVSGILSSVLGVTVPESISSFNKMAQETDQSYRESIRCGDIASACFHEAFRSLTVEEDGNLTNALQGLKNEVTRIEQALRDIEAQINRLSNRIDELTSQINSYNIDVSHCQREVLSSSFQMAHFRKYMY